MAVTPDTIAVALGRDSPSADSADYFQWAMWIADAEMLIDDRKTTLEIVDAIDEAKLDYVVREAVVAHVRRPDNATQVTVSVNDASTSKTYRSGRGRVEIIDEWWTLLGLTAPTGGAFAIDTVAASTVHADTCTLVLGGEYCSCGAVLAGFPLWGY